MHPRFTPYHGTVSKPRFSDANQETIIYPVKGAVAPNITLLSSKELVDCLGGNASLIQKKHQFLLQYRKHVLAEKWQIPSSYHEHTILIIVNCWSHSNITLSFLRNRYFPLFAVVFPQDFDVLFFSSQFDYNQRLLKNPFLSIGFYTYRSLHLAYGLYPPKEGFHYSGFLVMSDNSYVDPQFFGGYDLHMSWGESYDPFNKNVISMWNTLRNNLNVTFSQALMEAADELAGIPEINDRCLFTSGKALQRGKTDFWYICEKDIEIALQMEEIMFKHRVFTQFGVPTITHCLNPQSVIDCTRESMSKQMKCVHINPVNLANETNQVYIIKRIKRENLDEALIFQ